MDIGFIGLGLMGSRMAANLLEAGHALTVYNRTAEKADPLVARGARRAATPAEAARHADVLITMLADPPAVIDTAGGDDGFLEALPRGALWMDCSTVNPAFSRRMADRARGRGLRFVDAPVAGTTVPAEKGELTFLVGAAAADLAACEPLFQVMGRKIVHAGDVGAGTSLKMLFNLLLGQAMAAFSEALVLGEAMGLDRQRLLEILPAAPVTPPFIAGKRSKLEQGEFSPQFPLRWMRKDLQLAAQTAYEHDVPLPLTNATKEVYARAVSGGLGDADFSAVYRALRDDMHPPG